MTQSTDIPPAEPADVYWDPFDPALRDDPTRSGAACATRPPATTTTGSTSTC
jgi:hypothetical protein